MSPETLYHPNFVCDLFDRMSPSYTIMNRVTSLGFYPLWRKMAIRKLNLKKDYKVADLLAGPGDSWKYILPAIGKQGKITAIDFSQGMIDQAKKRSADYPAYDIEILKANIFDADIPDNSQDAVVCCYGLKTFSEAQLEQFSKELLRMLKPGGHYSLVEVAMPGNRWLKRLYLFYLRHIIPFIGKQFLKHPAPYNYLEVYSNCFKGFEYMKHCLESNRGNPKTEDLTWGCARLIWGVKS